MTHHKLYLKINVNIRLSSKQVTSYHELQGLDQLYFPFSQCDEDQGSFLPCYCLLTSPLYNSCINNVPIYYMP